MDAVDPRFRGSVGMEKMGTAWESGRFQTCKSSFLGSMLIFQQVYKWTLNLPLAVFCLSSVIFDLFVLHQWSLLKGSDAVMDPWL